MNFLPKELVFKILSYLDIIEVEKLELYDTPESWKFRLEEHFPQEPIILGLPPKQEYYRILRKNLDKELPNFSPLVTRVRELEKEIDKLREIIISNKEQASAQKYNLLKDQDQLNTLKPEFNPRTINLGKTDFLLLLNPKGNILQLRDRIGSDKMLPPSLFTQIRPGNLLTINRKLIYVYRESTIPSYELSDTLPERLIKDMTELGVQDINQIKKIYGI